MRHVELVAFENDSILHQKALLLPIGKVSLRQLGVLVVGILSVFTTYAITDNFWIAAVIFAIFLGIGMPNTKIMTPDQMIKSIVLFLIRGTSLSKKPEYLQTKRKSKQKEKKNKSDVPTTETQTNNNIMSKVLSQIESLYKRKESKLFENLSNNNKNYSIKLELTSENILNIIPTKIKQENNNTSIDKLLNSLTTTKTNLQDLSNSDNFLQEHVNILLDDKKLEDDQIISKKNNSASVLLDKSKQYDIETITDK